MLFAISHAQFYAKYIKCTQSVTNHNNHFRSSKRGISNNHTRTTLTNVRQIDKLTRLAGNAPKFAALKNVDHFLHQQMRTHILSKHSCAVLALHDDLPN